MPKITRIYGGNPDALPLRVTHRKGGGKKAPSMRVKCGCCTEAFVIFPENRSSGNSQADGVEINGVYASVAQWRELLFPILGLASLNEIHRFQSSSGPGINKSHVHPKGSGETITGRRLKPGEVLQRGDRYDSTSGKWEPIPYALVGNTIQANAGSILIRPAV